MTTVSKHDIKVWEGDRVTRRFKYTLEDLRDQVKEKLAGRLDQNDIIRQYAYFSGYLEALNAVLSLELSESE